MGSVAKEYASLFRSFVVSFFFALWIPLFVVKRVCMEADEFGDFPAAASGGAEDDDPADAAYNQPVRFPFAARAEHLWRADALYDLIVVIGHNDAPPLPVAGSAIFLHVAGAERAGQGLAATEGCVALEAEALRALIGRLAPGDKVTIRDDE